MGKRDRERVARIQAGEERPFVPTWTAPRPARVDGTRAASQLVKILVALQTPSRRR